MLARGVVALVVAILAGACTVGSRNVRLERDLTRYDRFRERPADSRNADDLLVIVAFSGGGARAAALSYGVLEEMARTTLPGDPPRRMLDEIDIIMAVSGGSFTAGYYGLRGDREGEAEALHAIPTTLQLQDADVDRLRAAATRLLRGSPDYQRLLRDLGSPLPDPLCPRAPGEPPGAC